MGRWKEPATFCSERNEGSADRPPPVLSVWGNGGRGLAAVVRRRPDDDGDACGVLVLFICDQIVLLLVVLVAVLKMSRGSSRISLIYLRM